MHKPVLEEPEAPVMQMLRRTPKVRKIGQNLLHYRNVLKTAYSARPSLVASRETGTAGAVRQILLRLAGLAAAGAARRSYCVPRKQLRWPV